MNSLRFAIKNLSDYLFLKKLGVTQFVAGGINFSRLGEFEDVTLQELAAQATSDQVQLALEFDLLLSNKDFSPTVEKWKELNFPQNISVRALDLGVMEWLSSETKHSLHLLLEAGFHNQEALNQLVSQYAERVQSYVISKELPWPNVVNFSHKLHQNQDIEIAYLTPILLFYSPRKLLHAHLPKTADSYLQVSAASQESVHKGFLTRENRHGTLFYHPKHQCLVSRRAILQRDWIARLIDLRLIDDQELRHEIFKLLINLESAVDAETSEKELEMYLPFETLRGFFETNKSNVLFPKLKNHHRLHDSYQYIGDIMDVVKGKGLVLNLASESSLALGDELFLQSPQDHQGHVTLSVMTDFVGQPLSVANPGQLVFINYMKLFPSKSAVFKKHARI